MVRITIDDDLKQKLLSSTAGEVVELVDGSGRIVGRVLPDSFQPGPPLSAATPDYSDDELDQLAAYDGPAISTEELLERVRASRK
ncbi:hypothetical protein [Botrimarina sp.]|uniref:hypothetical protein n=1 Tax=Botrimarina sp. TaxID=2795802 RepID=UPI0032EFB9C3